MTRLTCFKGYDIRGRVGSDLDDELAYRIGRAYAQLFQPDSVVLGHDVRQSSPGLHAALAAGFTVEGVDIFDIGHCGTEEVYFATDHLNAGGGLMVTASHNPKSDNGIKMIGPGARPITWENGLGKIHDLVVVDGFEASGRQSGRLIKVDTREAYAERVLSFIDPLTLLPHKVLVNAGNGSAGPTFDIIAEKLKLAGGSTQFMRINHEPNCDFPNGIPNPLLPENRPATSDAVRLSAADVGIAWDGDFDRCFLFDENGEFVAGEYVVALLAAAMGKREPGATIVHDPRVVWNTRSIVSANGGQAVASRTGHAFLKQTMRQHDALYGGEMSAHHYFRDFMFCDSGMIPWLLVLDLMSRAGQSLSELVDDMRQDYPSSGEMNFRLSNPVNAIAEIERRYEPGAIAVDHLDGLSMSFPQWRFNVRPSNTEPLLRLNVESLGGADLLHRKTAELSGLLASC